MKICSVEGCSGGVRARGWCNKHWLKWSRYGDPTAYMAIYTRKVRKKHWSECKGSIGKNGYLCFGKPRQYVHRAIMEEHLGRKLSFNETVHHKNSIRTDNRLENLEVISRSEHTSKHQTKYPIIDGRKECSICHKTLLLSSFYATKWNKIGYMGRCKSCLRETSKKHYA